MREKSSNFQLYKEYINTGRGHLYKNRASDMDRTRTKSKRFEPHNAGRSKGRHVVWCFLQTFLWGRSGILVLVLKPFLLKATLHILLLCLHKIMHYWFSYSVVNLFFLISSLLANIIGKTYSLYVIWDSSINASKENRTEQICLKNIYKLLEFKKRNIKHIHIKAK